ncbi:YqhG family protein [Bacillus sp. NPDC077027]|uniref:YqhG family protein n=1 Tax=Bacillus sp. NPDC077027 TaxID=3390548 RepID=UPI003CFC1D60
MQQHDIHAFLKKFFVANQCDIIEQSSGHMTVQLTIEMDKMIMNRPFYWHWLEKTGGVPEPRKLTLITDQEKAGANVEGEFIHFGSPRLFQIFEAVKQQGRFIRLYEQTNSVSKTQVALEPWLGVNVKISYLSDLKRDKLLSLGLHLIRGEVVEQFQEKLEKRQLSSQIPDYCFTMSTMIKPESGVRRLFTLMERYAYEEPNDWAIRAIQKWNEDSELLNQFYEGTSGTSVEYEIERQALQSLYEPKISLTIENGGLFYLQQRKRG